MRVLRLGVQCRHRYRWCGVAPDRFQQDCMWLNAGAAHLLGHHEAMPFIAYHQGRSHAFQTSHAQRGVLQHGVLTDQRQKLLGIGFTRHWP